MDSTPVYCSRCGSRFVQTDVVPLVCACGFVEHNAPLPIGVLLCGFGHRVLLLRSRSDSGASVLACPNAITKPGCSTRSSLLSKLSDETSVLHLQGKVILPGLLFQPEELVMFDEYTSSRLNLTYFFYTVGDLGGRVDDWWDQARKVVELRVGLPWNPYIREPELLTWREIQLRHRQELLPQHEAALERWLRRQENKR